MKAPFSSQLLDGPSSHEISFGAGSLSLLRRLALCANLSLKSDSEVMQWGSGPILKLNAIQFFLGDKCQHTNVSYFDAPKAGTSKSEIGEDGPDVCVSVASHGGSWGSVKGIQNND